MPPREGLSRRVRSLVTLGILIALRATDEEITEVLCDDGKPEPPRRIELLTYSLRVNRSTD
jgi:hypothetical protein